MSDRELCHSTSKPIVDEEDILKSFMTFDITPHEPAFRVVVENQIMVPQQSLPHNNTLVTQTYDIGSDTICWTMSYVILPQNQLVMGKTLKFFMAFDIMLYGLVLKVVVGGQIVVPQNNYNMKDICIYNLLVSFILDLLLSLNLLV